MLTLLRALAIGRTRIGCRRTIVDQPDLALRVRNLDVVLAKCPPDSKVERRPEIALAALRVPDPDRQLEIDPAVREAQHLRHRRRAVSPHPPPAPPPHPHQPPPPPTTTLSDTP